MLVVFVGIFMVKISRVLDKLSIEHKEEQSIEHVKAVEPLKPIGSVFKNNPTPIINNNENKKKITLEIEFPDLPEKIRVPYSKLPKLFELLEQEEPIPIKNMEKSGPSQPALGLRETGEAKVQREKEEPRQEEQKSWSSLRRHDNPLLDILEKVSGLEFSEDGNRVYCPRHGWVPYIVTSDGRILCGEEYETLWDPNKDRYPSKQELREIQEGLSKIYSEIEELRRQAQITVPEPNKQFEHFEPDEEEEEPEEEYEEE